VRSTLGHADTAVQQVNQQLPLLSGQITQTLQGVNKASDAATVTAQQATATMGDVRPRVDSLIDESRQTAAEARTVMGAMRTHWPFTGNPEPPAATGP
jgi:ABC-type transporter Mla subunit MlaD